MTFTDVANQLRNAASKSALNKAAELIQLVSGYDLQNMLGKIYKEKAAEFKR